MELKPACCNSKLLFFADFGHRCFPEYSIIKRRLPENFNYSHNLKMISKVHWASSVEKTMDTCGVAEHLILPCCCFMSLSPKLFLLCFRAVLAGLPQASQLISHLYSFLLCNPAFVGFAHLFPLLLCAFCQTQHSSSLSMAHVFLFLPSALSKHPPTLFLPYTLI